MKLTFLGTGTSQGVPIIGCKCESCQSKDPKDKRLRCSVVYTINDVNILVDIGPDFRQQMLRSNFDNLEAILLTHQHNDHIIGLDDVRPINFLHKKDIPVYASEMVHQELRQRFAYLFKAEKYPGIPQIEPRVISKEKAFYIKDILIKPIESYHGKLPILGFKIGDITYLTDVKTIKEEELKKISGTRILIINALHHKEHHSHLNLKEAIELTQKIGPEQAYFTHISHKMGTYADISSSLPKGIALAYDGLELNI